MTAPLPPDNFSPAGPKTQQRGIRLPQLLLSLLVVAVFALLAVWWQASTTSRTPMLALANDVKADVPLTVTDFTEIYLSSDVPPSVVGAEFVDAFLGTRPVTDLSQGTLINGDMVRRPEPLLEGQAFAGLIIDGNRAPLGLSPGDRVQVLLPASGGSVEIVSPDAKIEFVEEDGKSLELRLRLDVNSAQRVQLNARNVVLIEVDNDGAASWESEDPS